MTCIKSEHILKYKNLSVTTCTCTYSNRWNNKIFADYFGKFSRNAFKNYCTSSCFLNLKSVFKNLLCPIKSFSLHLETTKSVNRLRSKSEMCNNRN